MSEFIDIRFSGYSHIPEMYKEKMFVEVKTEIVCRFKDSKDAYDYQEKIRKYIKRITKNT